MKLFLAICLILVNLTAVNAQTTGIYSNKWEENDHSSHHKFMAKEDNEFTNTEMEVKDRTAVFSGLPDLKKPYMAVITNGEGEYIKQRRITPENNEVNLHSLNGGLYFVTILYKSKGQKTFVMNL